MAVFGVVLFLAAIAGNLVSAEESAGFVENLRSTRIVSGWEAEEGQIKYQLSIRMVSAVGGVSACGASIVHNEWGLTAAHCTAQRVTIVVRAGVTRLTRPELLFETTEYYNHPLYNSAQQSVVQPNDISLLKFNRFVPYSDLIHPINIQLSGDKDQNYNGVRLMASGFGLTWTGGSSPSTLNWVYLVGDSNMVCSLMYGGNSIIQDSTICASAYNITSQSTCQGDSGGPLVTFEDDGSPTLVGVTSFVSSSGCHVNMPAGFIRPGHYHNWYLEVTGIDFDQRRPPPTQPPVTEPITEPPIVTEGPAPPSSESSETDSGSSEGNGDSSEAGSGSPEDNGGSSETDSGSSDGNGGTSEGNGESSEGNGESSEANGGSSEADSGSPEDNGGSSETDSGSSDGNGGTSEGNGVSSEDNAGSSGADSGANSEADSESNETDNDDITVRDGFWTQWFQRNARH